MATTKQKRKYAQDFSGGSLTDQSFAPSCDVNNIVRHYEKTGIDPFIERKSQERYGPASTISYEQAMRARSEIDSAFALLPVAERLSYDNDANLWFDACTAPEPPPEALTASHEPPAEPVPPPAEEVGNGE